MAKTIQERLVIALTALGAVEIHSRSGKVRTFQHQDKLYFLGYGGAMRTGKCYSDSIPVSVRWKKSLLANVPTKGLRRFVDALADMYQG